MSTMLSHRALRVRYAHGMEGNEAGISHLRVANRVGLVDLPVADAIKRLQAGESFLAWQPQATGGPRTTPISVITDQAGHPQLHTTARQPIQLTDLPTF